MDSDPGPYPTCCEWTRLETDRPPEDPSIDTAASDTDAVVAALLATPAAQFVTRPGTELDDLRVHAANDAFRTLTGWTEAQLLDGPLARILSTSGGAGPAPAPHRDAVRRESSARGVLALLSAQGRILAVDVSVIPLRDPQGRVRYWSFTIHDRSEPGTGESSLRSRPSASEQRRALVESLVAEGLWDWEPSSGELTWSERLAHMVGLDEAPEEGGLRAFFGRVHPEDQYRVQTTLHRALTAREPFELECRLRHRDGHWIHTLCRGAGYRDQEGRLLRVLGAVRDVTDARAARAALADSEDAFADFAAALPGAVFRYTLWPDGAEALRFMNDGCHDIWELEAGAVEADPSALWAMVVEEDRAAMEQSIAASAERLVLWNHRWRVNTPSGRLKWLQGSGRPRRLGDGRVVWHSIIMDTTHQVTAEQALAESRDQLHRIQKIDALGKLTGGVAHDFNNLLTIVLSSLELLRDDPDAPDRLDLIDDAVAAAKRGGELTHDLLAFAKRATLAPRTVDLAEQVRQVVKLAERTLPENLTLRTAFDPGTPPVRVDAGALESALLNLVINARDAMPDGGDVVISTAPLAPETPGAPLRGRVTVRDAGAGIAREVQPFVFEPFFTTKAPGEGSGLGLSMVHGFVRQSGGDVALESEPGHGTAIMLTFPGSDATPVAAEAGAARLPTPYLRARVLLAEDEAPLRRIMVQCLTSDSCEVAAAQDGDEALRLWAREGPFDVLVTDARMPGGLQGADLVARLRREAPGLPCLIVTGYAEPQDLAQIQDVAPEAEVLHKPVGRVELLRAVTRLLEGG